MSLWTTPISQITFQDIDAFCKTQQPEGARLDYKGVSFPNDLAKTIAAFANTLGGLIILGVEAHQTDNKPVWPPVNGLPSEVGLSERVMQIAQEAIYPPVRIAVSQVITNPLVTGNVVLVVRVDESREAPHATEKKRHVYVYERTHDRNHPYGLADVERITSLLAKRGRLADQRELTVKENLARADRIMHRSITPIRWMSVSPVYPWFDVTDRWGCSAFHMVCQPPLWPGVQWSEQTFVKGSFAIGRIYSATGIPVPVCVSCANTSGSMFCSTYADEALVNNPSLFYQDGSAAENPYPRMMNLRSIREMATSFVEGCCKFYEDEETTAPGELMVSIGIRNAFGLVMYNSLEARKSNAGFPDDEFRVDVVVPAEDLIAKRVAAIAPVFEEIKFAFNAGASPM